MIKIATTDSTTASVVRGKKNPSIANVSLETFELATSDCNNLYSFPSLYDGSIFNFCGLYSSLDKINTFVTMSIINNQLF